MLLVFVGMVLFCTLAFSFNGIPDPGEMSERMNGYWKG